MMMTKWCSCFLLFLFTACSSSIPKQLNGTWLMESVYDNSNNVTAQHNPEQNRWITFLENGSFISGGQPYGDNKGKWMYATSERVLFLDSDAGEGDDSYWVIQLKKDTMNWTGAKSSFTERFRISFLKK